MNIAIIGRSELLYFSTLKLIEQGYKIKLIITCKEAPEYKKTAQDFEDLATKIGAKFIKSASINSDNIKSDILELGSLDLAVSINYSGILSDDVINLFSRGVLNVHGGDLPRYRGNACQAWAIINGEQKIGLCIHQMVGGELDSGNIISRSYYDLNEDTRIGEVMNWMEITSPELVLEAVQKLQENPNYILEKQSKDPKDILRCYPRRPEDGRIDWTRSNVEILRLINASSEPYQGAFCYYNDEVFTIWRAKIVDDQENYLGIPGSVSKINNETGEVILLTGLGKICISEISYQQKRVKPASIIFSTRDRLT